VALRDVGIYVDCDASMKTHSSRTVFSCFAVLRQIRSIRRSVSQSQQTVRSMVMYDDHIAGADTPRSRQCELGWCGKRSTGQASVCDECCCTARICTEVQPHLTVTPRPAFDYDRPRRPSSRSLCSPSFACTICLRRQIARVALSFQLPYYGRPM